MSDHRIRLTDREVELARCAAWSMSWALMPTDFEKSEQYKDLAQRLAYTKAGGQPKATRQARKRSLQEPSVR
jgi:hypothetical protein